MKLLTMENRYWINSNLFIWTQEEKKNHLKWVQEKLGP